MVPVLVRDHEQIDMTVWMICCLGRVGYVRDYFLHDVAGVGGSQNHAAIDHHVESLAAFTGKADKKAIAQPLPVHADLDLAAGIGALSRRRTIAAGLPRGLRLRRGSCFLFEHRLLHLHAAMQHGEWLVAGDGLVEIIFAKGVAGRIHSEALLAADAVRIGHTLSYAIANLARVQIDNERAAASISKVLMVCWAPALRDLDDQVH